MLQHEQQEEEEEANTQVAAVGADAATAAFHCCCLPQLCQRWRENPLELNYVNRLKQTNAECVKSEKGANDLRGGETVTATLNSTQTCHKFSTHKEYKNADTRTLTYA